jgi:hypothetical protein
VQVARKIAHSRKTIAGTQFAGIDRFGETIRDLNVQGPRIGRIQPYRYGFGPNRFNRRIRAARYTPPAGIAAGASGPWPIC